MSELLNDLEKSAAINRSDLNHAIINRKQREIQSGLDDLMNDSPTKQSPKPKFKASDKKTKYVSAYNKKMAEKKTPINPEVEAFINRAKDRQQGYAEARGRIEDMEANVKTPPRDVPKPVSPTPSLPKSNRNRNIGIGLAGAGAAALGGAYAYNRYKKKKRAEQEEKTAGNGSLLNDLEKYAGKYDVPEKFIDVKFKEIPKMEDLSGDKLSRLRNLSRNKKIGLGFTGAAAATGAGLYAHNRYKKKKRGEYGHKDE